MNSRDRIKYASMIEPIVKNRFESMGFHVTMEPEKSGIPFDIGNYRPDILASKNGLNVLVEVKSSRSELSLDRYFDIAEQVSSHKNWKFIIVDENTPEEKLKNLLRPYDEKHELVSKRIEKSIKSIETLILVDSTDESIISALFLMSCSNLESALELLSEKNNYPITYLSPSKSINHLYSIGEINHELYEKIGHILRERNSIAHGMYNSAKLESINSVIEAQREVMALVNMPSAE